MQPATNPLSSSRSAIPPLHPPNSDNQRPGTRSNRQTQGGFSGEVQKVAMFDSTTINQALKPVGPSEDFPSLDKDARRQGVSE